MPTQEDRKELRKEIIESLKTNRVAYKFWTPEEKEVANNIERKYWQALKDDSTLEYLDYIALTLGSKHAPEVVYRLLSGYLDENNQLWVHCDIKPIRGIYYYKDGFDSENQDNIIRLEDGRYRVGYGGILYEDCAHQRICKENRDSYTMREPEPCPACGPFKPVSVRFFKHR